MQFSTLAVVSALAAAASANYNGTAVVYTTEVHTAYTTVCPASTELTFNGVTYTATASTTLTITNCPCTIVKPVTTSSVVYCNTCAPVSTPVYANTTVVATTPASYPTTSKGSVGTTSAKVVPTSTPTTLSSSGADKLALSGASLAGLLGFAAYFL